MEDHSKRLMQAVKSVHRPVKNKMNRNVYLIAAAIFWMAATGLGGASMLTKRWRSGNPLGSSYDLLEICKPSIGCVALSWKPNSSNLHVFLPRILIIVGVVIVAIGTVLGLVSFFLECNCKICCSGDCPAEGALCVIGGCVVCLACGIFTALTYNKSPSLQDEYFDYSFFLAWSSGGAYLLAGSFICRAGRV